MGDPRAARVGDPRAARDLGFVPGRGSEQGLRELAA